MGCSDSALTTDTQQTPSANAVPIVDNRNRRLEEQSLASSKKTRNGFTVAQNVWQVEALNSHNSFRARHGTAPLVLDDAISRKAQAYAEYLGKNNLFQHSSNTDRDDLGENLYAIGGSVSLITNSLGTDATQSWYNEIKDYDFKKPGFSMTTGHFTQVVWKNTSKLGLGFALTNEGKKAIVVARYGPPGNVTDQFPENVLAPR